MTPEVQVLTLLGKLGGKTEQATATLHAMGVKGITGDSCQCVLAEYLKHDDVIIDSRLHYTCGVNVSNTRFVDDNGKLRKITMPPPLSYLITRFDRHELKELER